MPAGFTLLTVLLGLYLNHRITTIYVESVSVNQQWAERLGRYDELRRLARRCLRRERAGHSLQTTALVNEAYVRLVDYKRMHWQNRAHFLAVSAQAMRRILVDHARRRNVKRGADIEHVSLDAAAVIGTDRSSDFVSLDDALNALAALAPRKAQVVELRFFGGLSVDETAEVLHVSPITVMREWRTAKAWLYHELTDQPPA